MSDIINCSFCDEELLAACPFETETLKHQRKCPSCFITGSYKNSPFLVNNLHKRLTTLCEFFCPSYVKCLTLDPNLSPEKSSADIPDEDYF